MAISYNSLSLLMIKGKGSGSGDLFEKAIKLSWTSIKDSAKKFLPQLCKLSERQATQECHYVSFRSSP